MKEKERRTASGFVYLALLALIAIGLVAGFIITARQASETGTPWGAMLCAFLLAIDLLCLKGLFGVQPNQGVVLQLFGRYVGTERTPGLRWANPFYTKKYVSLRTRNFETAQLKVNDREGNPIEFAAIVVWSVVDTAEAIFQVDNYENYIKVQSEAALRNLAASYPYDAHRGGREIAARQHGRSGDSPSRRGAGAAGRGGHRRKRSSYQPSRVCSGDRGVDAATPAGGSDCCGADQDRRRRGGDGRDGAGEAGRETDGDARRGAQGGDGQQSAGGLVR